MKLYYTPGTCALSVHISLIWIGLPYELIEVDLSDPQFKKINPMGAVPALVDGDNPVMTQAHALLNYIAATDPDRHMAGKDAIEKQQFDQWMAFLASDLHPAYVPVFVPNRYTTDEDEAALVKVKGAAAIRLKMMFGILNHQLDGKDYLVADRLTFADSYAYVMTNWLHYADLTVDQFPNLQRHHERFHNDPAVVQAETEQGLRD